MKKFADLFAALDGTTRTGAKTEALAQYFASAPPADAAWAVYFLSGRRPRQAVSARKLSSWALKLSAIPEWLFDECHDAVGDLAETISLLLPLSGFCSEVSLSEWVEERLLPLQEMDEARQRESVVQAWAQMDVRQTFIWNKLVTGGFRVGVSQQLVIRALAQVSGVAAAVVAHRLMGEWSPTPEFFQGLISPAGQDDDVSRPYPYFLAHMLEGDAAELGNIHDWQAEWKWDGIRAQVIRRAGRTFIWSRGEELVTDRYPELRDIGDYLPDGTVVDGEILPWHDGVVLPFAQLQRRIGRKKLGKKLLQEVPVILMAYDLLELGGNDVRSQPLAYRRQGLEELIASKTRNGLQLSPTVSAESWEELARLRAESRSRHVEGLMLKRLDSPYRVGRQRGDWWKWKIQSYTVDAVLVYAQRGHGKRASLYTDYTFAVWDEGKLVPFAKAYSGLTDAEIRQVDAFIRQNTVEKFGPVRTVKPELVFELAFEGIQSSSRHKSGIAVRFPRISRWRTDKPFHEADTLKQVRSLLPQSKPASPADEGLFA